MNYLCITVRWLDDRYHGQNADGRPEWPPSPLRLFQAMVAGVFRRYREAGQFLAELSWIEKTLPAPIIVAPSAMPGQVFTRFVPNNDSDKEFDRQKRLTPKAVSPTLFLCPSQIHYLWQLHGSLAEEIRERASMLCEIARSIVALGWGTDMVASDGSIISNEQANALSGERWLPREGDADEGLRVPVHGTLDALVERHERFLARLGPDGFVAPPTLSAYKTVNYRRATDSPSRAVAVFSVLKLDASGFRSFDTSRRALMVAGMVRHATDLAAKRSGWSESKRASFILGHGESRSDSQHVAAGLGRFAYLPLPSIEGRGVGRPRVVGSVRRVMLMSFANDADAEIAWARRALSGVELIDDDGQQPLALLSVIRENDRVVRQYIQPAAWWATVTPVVLPGFDDPAHYRRRLKRGTSADEQKQLLDRLDQRIDGLLRKAIVQAGFSQVLADHAELEWRKAGFWPGIDLADRYGIPDHLRRFPRWHVRVQWHDAQGRLVQVPGPLCVGGGRFYGLGLFAAW